MLIDENGKEVKPIPGTDIGGLTVGEDLFLEKVITLHLDPNHPKYMKFLGMIESIRIKQKGLIKYTSGL